MKMLVISSRDLEKGSTKYRIEQYAGFLESRGIEIDYINRKQLTSHYAGRLDSFDVVFNQKCLFRNGLARKILLNSRKIIFDFDDAIYTRPGNSYSWITARRVRRRMRTWLEQATLVTTANEFLADYARRFSSSVEVIPMAIDLEQWHPKRSESAEGITIGWAGSPASVHHIERLDSVLLEVVRKLPSVKIAIFSGKRPELSCPFEYHPYQPGAELEFVQRLDIGLLPLTFEEYSSGKSPIKAIQYLACGVPVVGNVQGATAEILDESRCLKVDTQEDWVPAIERLLSDPDLRKSMGESGRKFVLEHHDTRTIREDLLRLIIGEEPSNIQISDAGSKNHLERPIRLHSGGTIEPLLNRPQTTPRRKRFSVIKNLIYNLLSGSHRKNGLRKLAVLERKLQSREARFAIPFVYRGKGKFKTIEPRQNPTEIESLYKQVCELAPKSVLEIGTARGGTLYLWIQAAVDNATIVSVDMPDGKFGGAYPECRIPFYMSFAREDQRIHLLRRDSHSRETFAEVHECFDSKPIDFAFIDGDHTYEGVKSDFEQYGPLVRPGGLIAFHDILPRPDLPDIQVDRFWNEIRDEYDTAEFVGSESSGRRIGIGLIRVGRSGIHAKAERSAA